MTSAQPLRPGDRRPPATPALGVAAAVLAVVFGLSVTGTVWFAVAGPSPGPRSTAPATRTVTVPQPVDVAPAVAAAGHLVPDIIGYDTEKLDTDIARAHDGMTARFRAEYDKAMTAVRSAPQRRKVTAEVREIGVVSASPDRVRVLAFVNQSVDTPVQTGGDGLQTRLRLTLVRQDSRWLVDEMSAE